MALPAPQIRPEVTALFFTTHPSTRNPFPRNWGFHKDLFIFISTYSCPTQSLQVSRAPSQPHSTVLNNGAERASLAGIPGLKSGPSPGTWVQSSYLLSSSLGCTSDCSLVSSEYLPAHWEWRPRAAPSVHAADERSKGRRTLSVCCSYVTRCGGTMSGLVFKVTCPSMYQELKSVAPRDFTPWVISPLTQGSLKDRKKL